MTFLDKSNDISEKLRRIQILKNGADEARALKNDALDCRNRNEALSSLLNIITIAKKRQILLTDLPGFGTLVGDIGALRERFKEQPKRETLVRGNRLNRIYVKVQAIQESTREIINEAWRRYCEINFALQSPVELETTVAQTEENKKLLAEYKAIFQTMRPMLSSLPDDDFAFDNLNKLYKQLKAILISIDFNVPEEVKVFLKSIAEAQGAPLSYLINPVVIEWLQNHDQMERYKIIRKI